MKGTYCLIIRVSRPVSLKVGALGVLRFEPGKYVYIGSALNGLEQRIQRHLSKKKRIFWHVDYLLKNPNVKIEAVYYKSSDRKEECQIAKRVAREGKPVRGFGCSDCQCASHLYKIKSKDFLKTLGMTAKTV